MPMEYLCLHLYLYLMIRPWYLAWVGMGHADRVFPISLTLTALARTLLGICFLAGTAYWIEQIFTYPRDPPDLPIWPSYLRYLSDLPNYMTRCFLMATMMMTTTLMTMTRLIMRRKILEALPPTLRSERKSNKGTFLATIVEWNLLPVSNWKGKMTRFVALKWYWWLKLWESKLFISSKVKDKDIVWRMTQTRDDEKARIQRYLRLLFCLSCAKWDLSPKALPEKCDL